MATDRGLVLLIAGLLLVLALTCCPPLTGASRLPTAFKRALLELESNEPQVIRAELIHRDHPQSPLWSLRGSNGSLADRHAAATAAQKARIARRLRAEVEFSTPISSGIESYGQFEYVMTLYLGTPVQKFVVIVDTGSDLVWVQCQPCTSPYQCYNETDPFFDPSASSSYSTVRCSHHSTCDPSQFPGGAMCDAQKNCHISYAYETAGSGIAGVLSTETIAFSNTTDGGLGISNFVFGCMDNDTASFGTVDGLAGFGRGPNSLPSQLSKLTSFKVFSYCLVPVLTSTSLTSPLLFGASESNGLQLVYTPILDNPALATVYWVNMTGISINGTALSIPQASLEWNSTTLTGGMIFDSGTTYTLLSQDIYTPVIQAFKNLIPYPIVTLLGDDSTLCYNISGVEQPEVLSMSLYFSGVNGSVDVEFPLGDENLFIPGSEDGTVCSAIRIQNVAGPNILGNYAQANHYVETDLVNKKIGWTSKDCSLPM